MFLFPIVLFFHLYILHPEIEYVFAGIWITEMQKLLNTSSLKLWLAMLGNEHFGFVNFGDPPLILVAPCHDTTIIFKPWVSVVQ